jgi:hypothetical protein
LILPALLAKKAQHAHALRTYRFLP